MKFRQAFSFARALRNRRFAFLWTGQTLSRTGDFIYQVALAWWILEKTGSPLAMGTMLLITLTPMLVLLVIGGVAVDQLPRIHLMLASDLGRGLVMMGIAGLAITGRLEVWMMMVAGLIFGAVAAFFQPAYTAVVPAIVVEEDWPSANSLTSMSSQFGRIAGPGLGAALVALGGTPLAFAMNGLSFFLSAALLLPLLSDDRREKTVRAAQPGVWQSAREGIALVLASPVLWITILTFAFTNVTLSGPYAVAMPYLVREYIGADVRLLGYLYTIFPIGYLIAGVWLGRKQRIHQRGRLLFLGAALAGAALAVFGLPAPVAVLTVAALVNGATLEASSLVWNNLLQEMVPGEKLGRVASIDMLGSYALMPVGYVLAGWATELLGPAPVFLLGGGITAAIMVIAYFHPAIRHLD